MSKAINSVVFVGVFIVLAIVFGAIVDTLLTDSTASFNAFETVAIAGVNGTKTLANTPVVTDSESLQNSAGVALVKDTNYTIVDATGVITLVNQNLTAGNVSYQYTKDSYISESTTRSFIVYLPVLFLLSALVFVAFKLIMRKN